MLRRSQVLGCPSWLAKRLHLCSWCILQAGAYDGTWQGFWTTTYHYTPRNKPVIAKPRGPEGILSVPSHVPTCSISNGYFVACQHHHPSNDKYWRVDLSTDQNFLIYGFSHCWRFEGKCSRDDLKEFRWAQRRDADHFLVILDPSISTSYILAVLRYLLVLHRSLLSVMRDPCTGCSRLGRKILDPIAVFATSWPDIKMSACCGSSVKALE